MKIMLKKFTKKRKNNYFKIIKKLVVAYNNKWIKNKNSLPILMVKIKII